MAHDVFVSHSAKDRVVAEKIVASLEAESIRCWVAPRDVIPGADWGESIIDAIESSRIMVLIFSRNADGSSQIKREVERAVDKDVYTIPFRIEDIEPTRSLEYFISSSQWMDAFTPPLEQHFDKLARTVKAILARSPVGASQTGKPPEPRPREETPVPAREPAARSAAWLKPVAFGAGLLLILGAVVWYSSSEKPASPAEDRTRSATAPEISLPPNSSSIPDPSVQSPTPGAPHPPANAAGTPPVRPDSATEEASGLASGISPNQTPVAEAVPNNDSSDGSPDLDGTTWNHNGSTVVLQRSGPRVSLRYRVIRPGLQGIVPNGATLFEGVATGNRYTGSARRFKKGFPPVEYEVSGGLTNGGKTIQLQGEAPARDGQGRIADYQQETLRFDYIDSPARGAEEPAAVVRRYYDSINSRDLREAYDCLSRGFKARSPMEKFTEVFASTRSIRVRELRETRRAEETAAVTVLFVEVDAENRSREWERLVSLVKEGEAWRIDRTQAVPPKN